MKHLRFYEDDRGTSAIEFAVTAPAFFAILFAVIEGALMLWTQLGLQHGVERAARCASVNSNLCGSSTAVQNYAAQQSFTLNPPPSIFTFSVESCGNRVSADYPYTFLTTFITLPSLAIRAQSCFPK